jgi:hypothetical protein
MKYRAALIIALSLGFASIAHARSQRVQQIPNGADFSCSACHVAAFPTGAPDADRNAFGEQVEANLVGNGGIATHEVDWQAIYALDADGDGYTNGEELGDPDGDWAQGEDPPRSYDPSHPADASSHQCDNLDLAKTDACASEDGGGEDAGAGEDVSVSTGTADSDDEGCSTSGAAEPVSTLAMIVVVGLGLATYRRRFLK